MPETPYNNGYGSRQSSLQQARRSPSKRLGGGGGDGWDEETRTIEEKQAFLGRFLNNVEDLVQDLKESVPFGPAIR